MKLMDNAELYPEGWRHRKFFGSRKSKHDKNKQPRPEDNIVDEIMQNMETERSEVEERHTAERDGADPRNVSANLTEGPPGVNTAV